MSTYQSLGDFYPQTQHSSEIIISEICMRYFNIKTSKQTQKHLVGSLHLNMTMERQQRGSGRGRKAKKKGGGGGELIHFKMKL